MSWKIMYGNGKDFICVCYTESEAQYILKLLKTAGPNSKYYIKIEE